jgi:hypothetical protein
MSLLIPELLNRVTAVQAAWGTANSVTVDAVPFFYHTQEAFPYFTNRVSNVDVGDDGSEDFDRDTYTVTMRLVVGHLTSGYDGAMETNLYTWMPTIKTYFNQREWLQSAGTYAAAMNSLIRARITAMSGLRVFDNAGISALQVACEFTLTCEFDETINLAYL